MLYIEQKLSIQQFKKAKKESGGERDTGKERGRKEREREMRRREEVEGGRELA